MVIAAAESKSLIAVSLPGTPYSVQRARLYVRTALGCHNLDDYAEDVEAVTSELVSNAVMHTGARAFGLVTLSIGITLRPAEPPVPSTPDWRLTAPVCWQT